MRCFNNLFINVIESYFNLLGWMEDARYEEKLICFSCGPYQWDIVLGHKINIIMKTKLNSALFTALFLTVAFAVQAQQKQDSLNGPRPERLAGGPMMPPPPNGPDGRKPGPHQPVQEAIKLTTLSGTVIKAIANDHFEYNGFLLKTGGTEVPVNYPAHLGGQIFSKAKAGTPVKVTGFYRINPEGKNGFQLVNVDVNGSIITDAPPALPTVAVNQQQKTISSAIKTLRNGRNQEINGFELNSGEVIGIPPHIATQLGTQLKAGENVTVTGFIEPKRAGVVYSQNVVQIKAQTLTINGQAYLIR